MKGGWDISVFYHSARHLSNWNSLQAEEKMRSAFDMAANIAVIILAAGMGTRMKSDKAKVLHNILGRPMVLYVTETAKKIAGSNIVLVIGNQAEEVREIVSEQYDAKFVLQKQRLGTGHAVSCAVPEIPGHAENVLILCGDVPLITSDTLTLLVREHLGAGHDVSLLAVEMEEPEGYGRILTDKAMHVAGIAEEADATPEQKKIRIINAGVYCVRKRFLKSALQKISSDNAQGEFYLTDIIKIGYEEGRSLGMLLCKNAEEVIGVNTPSELMRVETIIKTGKIS